MARKQVVVLNGYDIRDMLKQYGAAYRAVDKAWVISQDGFAKLAKLGASAAAGISYLRGYAKIVAYSEV